MATITAAERMADGSIVLTVREESRVIVAAKAAHGKKTSELKAAAKAQYDAAKLTAAEALVADKKVKP